MTPVLTRPMVWRSALALCSTAIVLLGAYGTYQLSHTMMSPVALVGGWMMLMLLLCYLLVRFRPSLGIPVFVGFGVGAVLVAIPAGMAMVSI